MGRRSGSAVPFLRLLPCAFSQTYLFSRNLSYFSCVRRRGPVSPTCLHHILVLTCVVSICQFECVECPTFRADPGCCMTHFYSSISLFGRLYFHNNGESLYFLTLPPIIFLPLEGALGCEVSFLFQIIILIHATI